LQVGRDEPARDDCGAQVFGALLFVVALRQQVQFTKIQVPELVFAYPEVEARKRPD
jgi:hypothetical protein